MLGTTGGVKDTPPGDNTVSDLIVEAKIGLNDDDLTRGKELIVTGSGFNNGTSAAVHVLHAPDPFPVWWNSLNCAERECDCRAERRRRGQPQQRLLPGLASLNATQKANVRGQEPTVEKQVAEKLLSGGAAESTFCRYIIREGHRAGIAEVGSSDTVDVAFEVTVPIFGAGNTNYLCMVDGEAAAPAGMWRTSSWSPASGYRRVRRARARRLTSMRRTSAARTRSSA